nr:SDR family NAD(P)-dependent oxidoreductase [Oceanococcus sp. HetDA_MAG_MS8]
MQEQFQVGAWLAPLPGSVAVWLDLNQRQRLAVLDLRAAPITAEQLQAQLPDLAQGQGYIGVAADDPADPRVSTVLTWAHNHGRKLRLYMPATVTPPQQAGMECWAEVRSAEQLSVQGFAGLLLTGHEGGGLVAAETSFVLLQKAQQQGVQNCWVRGAVGPATAAACAAGHAAGAFLDDALLLFPELGLPADIAQTLGRLNGSETRLLGEALDLCWRGFAPPRSPALERMEALESQADRGELSAEQMVAQLGSLQGWGADQVWPVGQGIGIAARLAAEYGRIAQLLARIEQAVPQQLQLAAKQQALAEGAPLARSQGTTYPLVQGPMTRVSDSPAFAQAVAEAGAMPFLALALMRGPQVEAMLQETTQRLGDKPWGVGLLGFIPEALRKEQLEVVQRFSPSQALIAGGRPDQAASFESKGVPAWLHVPSPALLKLYLEQGARRFIFEGRECGGHIGPLASFALWEQAIAVLCTDTDAAVAAEVEVLFAGGISDALSGQMVAALAAPLVERGVKIGALMGTAYLFTREIVDSGAIVPEFAAQAVACTATRNLITGPGHATRCAATPFAEEFRRQRQNLAKDGLSAEALRDALEDLNMGRLRLASKGAERDDRGQLVERDVAAQRSDGMYMIGQVAMLRSEQVAIADLHAQVCASSSAALAQQYPAPVEPQPAAQPTADIAIVGINMILPGAPSKEDFWQKIVGLESCITEVPQERWDLNLYFDPDKSARDKIYSRWGGFLDDVVFEPTQYGIAPASMRSIDPLQLLSLESTARALADTGWKDQFDREHTSIILGAGGGVGELGLQYGVRAEIPRFVENPDEGVWDRLPEWTNESFAGVLLNVAAGRIANRLNFGGVNFVVDAACGSSLAAITLATQELSSGRANVAIAGGVDNVQGPYGFLCFAKTQALSPTGQPRTFDQSADGIVISEGVATVVMKRLADAQRDGDRIYAVIKGAAGSSDGKALGMTAPLPAGQKRALRRVYAQAGFGPQTLGYVEAHGTGTAVGDRAEAETITETLREHGAAPQSTAVGSAKTLVGHTKCAAGVVGLIKSTLALHHQVLPGHYGVSNPIAPFQPEDAPAYLLKQSRPWLARPGQPRRAAVSAFGFGGTNFHAALEEYPDPQAVVGGPDWPHELILLSADSSSALVKKLEALAQAVQDQSPLRLADVAASLAAQAKPQHPCLLALVSGSKSALREQLQAVLAHLQQGQALPGGAYLRQAAAQQAPKLAFLFPGQGAQAVDRGRAAALHLKPLRAALEQADQVLAEVLPRPLSSVLWPASAFSAEAQRAQQAQLTDTRYAQPALGALSLGFLNWFQSLGIQAAAVAGHSYGEFVALHAAGACDASSMLSLSAARGAAMASAAQQAPGAMAAILAPREEVEALLAEQPEAYLANHNSPEQVVITGTQQAVDAVLQAADKAGLRSSPLPVAGAFHSPLMQAAQAPLSAAIQAVQWSTPQLPVYANANGQPYPTEPQALADQLDAHLLGPVEFVAQLQAMQADGITHFVELGSKQILQGMVRKTLGAEVAVLSVDADQGGVSEALEVLAQLIVAGVPAQAQALFAGRARVCSRWEELMQALAPLPPKPTAYLLSGGAARPLRDPEYKTGKQPALTAAAKEAAVAKAQQNAPVAQPSLAAGPTPPTPAGISATPSTAPAPAQLPAAGLDPAAFAAYQQTMREFLALQERALSMALNQTAPAPVVPAHAPTSLPTPLATPAPSSAAPSSTPAAVPAASEPRPPTLATPPAAPAPVAVAAEPAALDAAALVLEVTADKTGYPADMLDVSADLEADLGIDSIKRVEIVGAIQKQLPADVAAAMQDDLERYTRAKTLTDLASAIQALIGEATSAPAPVVETAASPSPASPSVDIAALVLQITADKTGYPADMLDVHADLEADLGVDSIKRVEIVGALQKQLPSTTADAMQADLERYTRAKSLDELTARIQALTPQAAAPGPSLPVAASTAAPAADVDIPALVLEVTADKTGYPAEMLDAEADLEADLGIDSIKRVEIVGAIQKQLPAALAEAMQAELERYTRAKTLSALCTAIQALAPATVAPSQPAAQPASQALDVAALVVEVTADKTGYPADMLDTEADLEADLGIDSIKRVEIVGAIQKQLPADIAEAMQADLEQYTRAKTLGALTQAVNSLQGLQATSTTTAPPMAEQPASAASPVADAAAPAPTATTQSSVKAQVIPRQRPVQEALEPAPSVAPLGGRLLVIGADAALEEALVGQCADAAELDFQPAGSDYKALLAENWRAVLYLPALLAETQEAALALLEDWRQLASSLQPGPGRSLLVATRLGGSFARLEPGVAHPISGGLVGGMLCLAQELPELCCRVADFDGQDSQTLAKLLLKELQTRAAPVEVAYMGERRFAIHTQSASLNAPLDAQPQAGQVILALGGARGITLACLQDWVRRQPQTTLVLLGRSQPATPDMPSGTTAQIRQALIAQAQVSAEKRSPRELDAELRRIEAAHEVAAGIASLQSLGAQVEYHAMDARDAAAMEQLLAQVRSQHGAVHGVIHAAGVIEDKLLADKTADSFARVIQTKLAPL